MKTKHWSELRVGEHFSIPGFDDLLVKANATHAKALGCGWLKRPTRFARKGQLVLMATPGSDCSALISR